MPTVTISPGNFSAHPYNPPPTAPGWPPSGGAPPGSGPLGAVPVRRGSGAEAMAAVLISLILLIFMMLSLVNPLTPLGEDDSPFNSLVEFLFGGVWYIVVGFALCLRRRGVAGSAVVLLFFAPYVLPYAIAFSQNDSLRVNTDGRFTMMIFFATIISVVLFGVFVMRLIGGSGGAGVPSNALQLSEAALAYCLVNVIIGLFEGVRVLMGSPLHGAGVANADIPPTLMVVYVCCIIALIMGIGAIVVLKARRSRGVYAGLLSGQTALWAVTIILNCVRLVNDVYHRFYPAVMMPNIIVGIIVLLFALMAWAPSAEQWFAGIPAPGVNFGAPVMAAAPAPVAVPQQIVGADGRMYTVMAAAPAPMMGGAPGVAGGAFAPAAPPASFPQAAAPAAPPPVGYGSSSGPAPSST